MVSTYDTEGSKQTTDVEWGAVEGVKQGNKKILDDRVILHHKKGEGGGGLMRHIERACRHDSTTPEVHNHPASRQTHQSYYLDN